MELDKDVEEVGYWGKNDRFEIVYVVGCVVYTCPATEQKTLTDRLYVRSGNEHRVVAQSYIVNNYKQIA